MKSVIVVGGGAAGLMAAGTAGKYNENVILIEKNKKLGKKLYLTGKGRCNLTNSEPIEGFVDHIVTNGKFLYSALYSLTNRNLIDFFNKLGVKTKIERGGRVFPESNKSNDIISALKKYLHKNNVNVIKGEKVADIKANDNSVNKVLLESGKQYSCKSVIIATGGLSYPFTGATGDGYKFAKKFGHSINKLLPSLVPLKVKEEWVRDTEELTLKNTSIIVYEEGNKIYEDFGELIFTDYGIKGPVVLSASSHLGEIREKKYKIVIDLKPALSKNKLDDRIQRDFRNFSNKYFGNSLNELLPVKIIPVIIKLSSIPYKKKVNQITVKERERLVNLIKGLSLNIIDYKSMEEAIITSGGVNINEIKSTTMESKKIKNLYFAGEVIDVDAYTGGYNLQIAFSTGYLAGLNC